MVAGSCCLIVFYFITYCHPKPLMLIIFDELPKHLCHDHDQSLILNIVLGTLRDRQTVKYSIKHVENGLDRLRFLL